MSEQTSVVEAESVSLQPVQQQLAPRSDRAHADAKQARVDQVSQLLAGAYQQASTLTLSEAEDKALGEPFPDEAVEIRAHDGLLYIPHIWISDRLNKVIGRGQWSLVRRSEKFDEQKGQLYAECILLIRGCFVGESIGAMQYVASNPKMNYSDALEGAQSEALRRIAAKRLGIGDQVWRPDFCRKWIAAHARQDGGKWKRNDSPAQSRQDSHHEQQPERDDTHGESFETASSRQPQARQSTPQSGGRTFQSITEKQSKRLYAIGTNSGGLDGDELNRMMGQRYPYIIEDGHVKLAKLKPSDYDGACSWAETGCQERQPGEDE